MKLALDNNISGVLIEPSSYLMKSPPEQYPDSVAKNKTEEFIKKYGKKSKNKKGK
jgi:myo-inositol-1-phosphate synthase